MTNEELRKKYRLLKLVAEQEERTYQALDPSGHIVMVHFLSDNASDSRRLLALVNALSPADKTRIVEHVEVDGAPVLVTQFIQEFKTLLAWLERRTQRPHAAPAPASRGPGEVTAMFGPPTAEPAGPAAEPGPPREPGAAAGVQHIPGDFTGVFGAASGTPAALSPQPPSAPSGAPSPPVDRPGTPPPGDKPSIRWREPTAGAEQPDRPSDRPVVRWKKGAPLDEPSTPPQAPAPAPAPPSPPLKQVGEFTRLFGPSGSGATDPGDQPATSPPPAPADPWNSDRQASSSAPPRAGPGEFTRLFQSERKFDGPPPSTPERAPRDYLQALNAPKALPDAPAPFGLPTPPAPAPAKQPGEFTRLMAGVPAAPIGGAPGVPGGPSDFTRVVAGIAAPQPQSPPPADEAPGAEAQRRWSPRLVVLLIALGVIGILAITVVLYVALKQ